MHVISKSALKAFWERHADAREPLRVWFRLTEQAKWRNLTDVRKTFNSVDAVGVFTIFNIKGAKYRIITAIHYNRQKVFIRNVFTHAEYNRWNKEQKQ